MYNFKKRFNDLIRLDKIRIYKLLEMLQFTFITFIIVIFITTFLNKNFLDTKKKYKLKVNVNSIIKDFIKLFFKTYMLVIIVYYSKKIILLFPSLPALYDKQFNEHSTLEYTLNIALIVVLFEMLHEYHNEYEKLSYMIVQYIYSK
jgi:hypothetical protein